jgi:cobalt/nickel transport system permease protein
VLNVVGRVDLAAASGTTVWHRASALSKLGLALLLVLLAVFSRSLPLLVALHLSAWLLALSSRLPLRVVAAMLGYPLLFTVLFTAAAWDGTLATTLRLVLRPTTACLAAVWLVATTPYPDLFAPISRLLPRRVADGLFITYRAVFELIGRTERLLRAQRLRGGSTGAWRRKVTASGESVGTLVLHSFGRSERLYAAMLLRGHSGRICGCRHYAEAGTGDRWVAGAAALVVALALGLGRRG